VFTARYELNLNMQFVLIFVFKSRVMAETFSLRSVASEAWVRSHILPCEICGGQSGTGAGFSSSTFYSLVGVIPPVFHIHLYLRFALTRTNGLNLGTFQKRTHFQK